MYPYSNVKIIKETKTHITYSYEDNGKEYTVRFGKFLCIGGTLDGLRATQIDVGDDYEAFNASSRSKNYSQIWVYNKLLQEPTENPPRPVKLKYGE